MSKLRSNSLIAILTLLALLVAVFGAIKSEEHNRNTIRPHLMISQKSHLADPSLGLGIWLNNKGLGPALITEFLVTVDGEKMTTEDKFSGLFNATTKLQLDQKTHFLSHAPGDVIETNYSKPVFWYKSKHNKANKDSEDFAAKVTRLGLLIRYSATGGGDIYEVSFNTKVK